MTERLLPDFLRRTSQHSFIAIAYPSEQYFNETKCGARGYEMAKGKAVNKERYGGQRQYLRIERNKSPKCKRDEKTKKVRRWEVIPQCFTTATDA